MKDEVPEIRGVHRGRVLMSRHVHTAMHIHTRVCRGASWDRSWGHQNVKVGKDL